MRINRVIKRFMSLKGVPSLLIGLFLLSSTILVACDSDNISKIGPDGKNGKGCNKVGILLPDSTTSARWGTKDHPLLVQAISAALPNVHIDYNAHDNQETQLKQAETGLANGNCMLVVAAPDSVAASAIVNKARRQNVPVIAYDRLIQSKNLNYYVSFDGVKIGALQGQYIADHYQQYQKNGEVNVAMISGSQNDINALLFSMGMHQVLDPLFANGTLKSITEVFTPDWNINTAQTEMEAILNDQQNNIQIVYVANDNMANSVLAVLRAAGLNGRVLVTGQDATVAGIHNILAGDQNMTIYKPINKVAQSVGALVKALHDGTNTKQLTNGVVTSTYDGGSIPSILDATSITVDRDTIATTVIADHFIDKKDVCNDIPAGTANVC